jgi:hypothetical protein
LDTGSITPQFHVVLDDWCHTVSAIPSELPDFDSPEWINMFGNSSLQYVLDDADVTSMRELSMELENAIDTAGAVRARDRVLDALYRHPPASSPAQVPPTVPLSSAAQSVEPWREITTAPIGTSHQASSPSVPTPPESPVAPQLPSPATASPTPPPALPSASSVASEAGPSNNVEQDPSIAEPTAEPSLDTPSLSTIPENENSPSASPPVLRRSLRHSRAPTRLDVRHTSEKSYYGPPGNFHDMFSAFNCSYNTNFIGPLSDLSMSSDLFGAYTAQQTNPDVFTFHQVMKLPDKDEWMKAALKEILELEDMVFGRKFQYLRLQTIRLFHPLGYFVSNEPLMAQFSNAKLAFVLEEIL